MIIILKNIYTHLAMSTFSLFDASSTYSILTKHWLRCQNYIVELSHTIYSYECINVIYILYVNLVKLSFDPITNTVIFINRYKIIFKKDLTLDFLLVIMILASTVANYARMAQW